MKNTLAKYAYKLFNILLAALVALLVINQLELLAIPVVIAGKWRTFAVRPYYWLKNIRANSCDFTVGISTVVIMSLGVQTNLYIWVLAGLYGFWLLWIKPSKSPGIVGLQAVVCQAMGSGALWLLLLNGANYPAIMILNLFVSATAIRHLLSASSIKALKTETKRLITFSYGLSLLLVGFFSWIWTVVFAYSNVVIPQMAILALVISVGWFVIIYHSVANIEVKKQNTVQQLVFMYLTVLIVVVFSYTRL